MRSEFEESAFTNYPVFNRENLFLHSHGNGEFLFFTGNFTNL